MPGVQKHILNERIAVQKAYGQRVYISGLEGQQSLQTGVAYHYRGHYLYAYPAGNPIEPVPFSTKKGINIVGTIQDVAPLYSPNASDLVPESSIAALNKSRQHMFKAQKEEEQQSKMQVEQTVESEEALDDADIEMPVVIRPGSYALRSTASPAPKSGMTPLIPSQVSSRAPSQCGPHTSLPCLAVHDAHSNIGYSNNTSAQQSLPQSLRTNTEMHAFRDPMRFSTNQPSIANPQLHYTTSSPNDLESMTVTESIRMLQRFASDPSGMVNLDVPRVSSRAGSRTSLASMIEHDVRYFYGDSSLRAGAEPQPSSDVPSPYATPALSRSVSRVGSHTALANLSLRFDRASHAEHSLGTGAGSGSGPHIFSRGPSPLGTPALSSAASHTGSHGALADLTIYDGTYYREGSAAAKSSSFHLSPSLPSITKAVSTETTHSGGYQFGSTLTPLNGYQHQEFANSSSFTPHDRALFLADSAPGSRLPSVAPSRAVSPNKYLSSQDYHNGSSMRHIASTSRLHQILAKDRSGRIASPLSDIPQNTEGMQDSWAHPSTIAAFASTASRTPSPLVLSPPNSRNKPIGTGRPRRASVLLNQAHNAAKLEPALGSASVVSARIPKCAIHGEGCDGVSLSSTWKTKLAEDTTGFREIYPMISGKGGRVMLDWVWLLKEQQGREVLGAW